MDTSPNEAAALAIRIARVSGRWWTLDADKQPVPAPSFEAWAVWMTADPAQNYRQAYDQIEDNSFVSTIFIGFEMCARPPMFETAVCDDGAFDDITRSTTYAQAMAVHAGRVVTLRAKRSAAMI